MQWPNARIVSSQLNHQIPIGRHQLRVSSLRVLRVHHLAIPRAGPYCQNKHLLPVEMHWVPERYVVVHDDANAFISGEIVDISFGIEGGAGGFGRESG